MTGVPDPSAAQPLEQLRLRSDRRLLTGLLVGLIVPVAWFAWLDLSGGVPGADVTAGNIAVRVVSVAVPLAGVWLVGRARTRTAFSQVAFRIALVSVPVLLLMLLQLPRGLRLPIGPMLMILFVMYGALSNTVWRQVLPPVLMSAGIVAIRVWWLNDGGGTTLVSDLLVLAFVNVTGIAIVRRRAALQGEISQSWNEVHRALEREQQALQRERVAREAEAHARHDLTALRGIIPICSNCKKVRVGRQEWQQIESYVRDHSDAQFSHGICPSCTKQLYPEYAEDEHGQP